MIAACFIVGALKNIIKPDSDEEEKDQVSTKIVFLGSGSSNSTPFLACMLGSLPNRPTGGCTVCQDAAKFDDPDNAGNFNRNKNHRNNPSILIQYRSQGSSRVSNYMIDCGRTFRDAALAFFGQHGVDGLDAVLLTHNHSDAVHGVDDLRNVQRPNLEFSQQSNKEVHWLMERLLPIKVYCSSHTMRYMKRAFSYLFPTKLKDQADGNSDTVVRYVAKVEWQQVVAGEKFLINNELPCLPFEVWHGHDYKCLAFLLGEDKQRLAYISDVSEVPAAVLQMLQSLERIDLLVVDCLLAKRQAYRPKVHFDLTEAVDLARTLRPCRTLLLGISHGMDHYKYNAKLVQYLHSEGLDIQLSFDGMVVHMDL